MISRIWVFMTTAIIIIVSVVLLVLGEGQGPSSLTGNLQVQHLLDTAGRLMLAIGLTVGIGLEREVHHKPAGVRTVAMVGLGACVMGLIGTQISSQSDAMSRVIQGVLTGIGFLGAGTIIKDQFHVEGLTTAATLWTVAAIGLCCGIGLYQLAILSTVAVFVILSALRIAERMVRPE